MARDHHEARASHSARWPMRAGPDSIPAHLVPSDVAELDDLAYTVRPTPAYIHDPGQPE